MNVLFLSEHLFKRRIWLPILSNSGQCITINESLKMDTGGREMVEICYIPNLKYELLLGGRIKRMKPIYNRTQASLAVSQKQYHRGKSSSRDFFLREVKIITWNIVKVTHNVDEEILGLPFLYTRNWKGDISGLPEGGPYFPSVEHTKSCDGLD